MGTLGAGGMGEVYRARDTRLGRAVAAFQHPHIVTIHAIESAEGAPVPARPGDRP